MMVRSQTIGFTHLAGMRVRLRGICYVGSALGPRSLAWQRVLKDEATFSESSRWDMAEVLKAVVAQLDFSRGKSRIDASTSSLDHGDSGEMPMTSCVL